jgi:hypothetical protein
MISYILEPDDSTKAYRKNWARLIQRIYEVDPLICPKCQGLMKILSFIESSEVIKKNLQHLGLWFAKREPQPVANAPPTELHIDYSARPGATRLPVAAPDYVLFQT